MVLVLDRSGSMAGWKMVAARRAAARMVDTLTPADRFAVLAFDDSIETPQAGGPAGTNSSCPRPTGSRFRAVEFLARLDSRGGTEMAEPLAWPPGCWQRPIRAATASWCWSPTARSATRTRSCKRSAARPASCRIFTLGIDQAVNAGFLRRLAAIGGGSVRAGRVGRPARRGDGQGPPPDRHAAPDRRAAGSRPMPAG